MSGTDGLVTGGVPGLEIDLTQVTTCLVQKLWNTVIFKDLKSELHRHYKDILFITACIPNLKD